jgi:hypothetical protein
MHVSPFFNFAAMSARMWLDPPELLSARRIEIEALDGPFAMPAPRQPVPISSFPERDDNWS